MKRAIVFDLDGTLAESKQSIDSTMADLLGRLLAIKKVAVVSGGGIVQLQKQVVDRLSCPPELLQQLYLFPTKGAMMYVYQNGNWVRIYEKSLSAADKEKIRNAFQALETKVDFLPTEHFGDVLEDRDAQFTFSALGQNAPVALKETWDPDAHKRQQIKKMLEIDLPEFAVEIGGTTSIDITQKNIDKAFALTELCHYEHLSIQDLLFVGDALFPGGNDHAVTKTGVDTIAVANYNETKDVISNILKETV